MFQLVKSILGEDLARVVVGWGAILLGAALSIGFTVALIRSVRERRRAENVGSLHSEGTREPVTGWIVGAAFGALLVVGGISMVLDLPIIVAGLMCVFLPVMFVIFSWIMVVAWRFAWRQALESNSTGDFCDNVARSLDLSDSQLLHGVAMFFIVNFPVYLLLCVVMLIRLLFGVGGGEVTSRNIIGSIVGVVVAVILALCISIPGLVLLNMFFQGDVSMWWILLPSGLVICGGIAGFSYPKQSPGSQDSSKTEVAVAEGQPEQRAERGVLERARDWTGW
jgi:hypothetical protein